MVIQESINSAYEAIRSNLLRSLLTALAIIIGTAAVISMIAIGSTAQNEIQKSMDSLGGKNVSIFAGQKKKRGVRSNYVPLTMDDAKALKKDREIQWQVSPQMEARKQVKFRDKNASLAINATDGSYFSVEGLDVIYRRGAEVGYEGGTQGYRKLSCLRCKRLASNQNLQTSLVHMQ